MKIINVEWTDESQYDASVTISDDRYAVVCFSSPFSLDKQMSCVDKIYGFNVENIQRSDEEEPEIKKGVRFYEYSIKGRFEKKTSIVRVGEILIDISDGVIPKDILDGEMIEFTVNRLDLY